MATQHSFTSLREESPVRPGLALLATGFAFRRVRKPIAAIA